MSIAEQDPTGKTAHEPGAKLDSGKIKVWEHFVDYFPDAILAVTKVSDFGAKKYTSRGWLSVPDGIVRYTDALTRHLIAESFEDNDPDSDMLHAAHVAWNALARLQLMLEEESE